MSKSFLVPEEILKKYMEMQINEEFTEETKGQILFDMLCAVSLFDANATGEVKTLQLPDSVEPEKAKEETVGLAYLIFSVEEVLSKEYFPATGAPAEELALRQADMILALIVEHLHDLGETEIPKRFTARKAAVDWYVGFLTNFVDEECQTALTGLKNLQKMI